MKSELFSGALRFSPFWLTLDFLALIQFGASWLISVRKSGWKIDFYHLTLFQLFIIPVFFTYPFNASFLNMLTIGSVNFLSADPYIDYAFFISILGYLGILIGAKIYSMQDGARKIFSLFTPLSTVVIKNIRSKKVLLSLFFITLTLTLAITLLSSVDGFFLRPRAYFQVNELIRPLYNLTIAIAPIFITFLSLYCIDTKEKWAKKLLLFSILLSVLYGVRGILISSLFFLFSFSILKNRGFFSLRKGMIVASLLVVLALELEKTREGNFSNLFNFNLDYLLFVCSSLLYGNHFSDTRDFAWVLGNWDEHYLYGLGYLANIVSFIPSSLLEFRREFSLSPYTSDLIGLDTSIYSGVRPGPFGQLFFNFGPIGVFLGGILIGLSLKYGDTELKIAIEEKGDIILGYAKTIPFFCITSLLLSQHYWHLYLFILINVFCRAQRQFRAI